VVEGENHTSVAPHLGPKITKNPLISKDFSLSQSLWTDVPNNLSIATSLQFCTHDYSIMKPESSGAPKAQPLKEVDRDSLLLF
jgi:hypothetical protein